MERGPVRNVSVMVNDNALKSAVVSNRSPLSDQAILDGGVVANNCIFEQRRGLEG